MNRFGTGSTDRALRIGNVTAARADSPKATRDLIHELDLDAVILDVLSDETMLELAAEQAESGRGHVGEVVEHIRASIDRIGAGTRFITNGGGLDPHGLIEELQKELPELGGPEANTTFAWLDGGHIRAEGTSTVATVATVRYGAAGIAAALAHQAQLVVTGRVSREALVVGAAQAFFHWSATDWDKLAGAAVAGHILSGGPGATGVVESSTDVTRSSSQATGGVPLAEIRADGSVVITRHSSSFGSVTVGTVTDQLLDGADGRTYFTPDVLVRLDSVQLTQEGTDRVRISGARGEPPKAHFPVLGLVRTGSSQRIRRIDESLARDQAKEEVALSTGETIAPEPVRPAGTAPDSPPEPRRTVAPVPGGPTTKTRLGSLASVRRGVVNNGINIAVWTWDDTTYSWLDQELTEERFIELVAPGTAYRVTRSVLPNLRAVNFGVFPSDDETVPGTLGQDLVAVEIEAPAVLLEVDP